MGGVAKYGGSKRFPPMRSRDGGELGPKSTPPPIEDVLSFGSPPHGSQKWGGVEATPLIMGGGRCRTLGGKSGVPPPPPKSEELGGGGLVSSPTELELVEYRISNSIYIMADIFFVTAFLTYGPHLTFTIPPSLLGFDPFESKI